MVERLVLAHVMYKGQMIVVRLELNRGIQIHQTKHVEKYRFSS